MSDFGAIVLSVGILFSGAFIALALRQISVDILKHWYAPENRNRDFNFNGPIELVIKDEEHL